MASDDEFFAFNHPASLRVYAMLRRSETTNCYDLVIRLPFDGAVPDKHGNLEPIGLLSRAQIAAYAWAAAQQYAKFLRQGVAP